MSTDDQVMRVLSFAEVEAGWAFVLQTPRYLETRSWSDMVIGHGLIFVDRQTGDVYSSGSGQPTAGTVLGFSRAVADGTGIGQVPVNEQLRPAIDLYHTRLLRAAGAESDQTVRDRLWIHVLDTLRLGRLAISSAPTVLLCGARFLPRCIGERLSGGAQKTACIFALERFDLVVRLVAAVFDVIDPCLSIWRHVAVTVGVTRHTA